MVPHPSSRLRSSTIHQVAHVRHFLGAILVVGALASSACSKPTIGKEAPSQMIGAPEVFPTATPERTNVVLEREYVGEVRAVQYGEIRSRSLGTITSVLVDEGQSVKAGQVLFTLSAQELQQNLRKSKAETKTAEAELVGAQIKEQNKKLLFEKDVVSDVVMDLASSKVALLKAKIDESKATEAQVAVALTYAQVKAPFDGVVNRIHHRVGSLVNEDKLLTTLTDTREVFVYFRMSERDYLEFGANTAVANKAPVTFRLADGRMHASKGVVDAVESEFDRETGNIAFRARLPNPDATLRHGSTGKIVIERELEDVLLVPQRSTFEVQGDLHVYVLDGDNVAHARRVVPLVRLGDSFVISSGLDAGERFVVEGVQRLKEGSVVGVDAKG